MKESDHEPGTNRSLLYLQLVFALFAGMLNLPLDLVGAWLIGKASPSAVGYAEFHLLSAVIFAAVTFCAWHWIIPHLRGVLVLRLLVQVMLGIVMFGYALMATYYLWQHLPSISSRVASQFENAPAIVNMLVISGATLYMILGGLSLGRASQEHLRLRELALRAQLEALRSQLNHHFLFNSLNVIAEAAAVQPERAEKLILQLAGVLRYSLGASRARMAPLSEELAAVASYLELERARSGNRISVDTEIAADVGDVRVPPLLIQPLVENAVGHGLLNGTCAGKISIAAWRNENSLCIRVMDNGVGFEPNRNPRAGGAGVGLSNLRERLRAFYGDNAAFHLHSSVDGGTVAEISLSLAIRADAERAEHGFIWRTFFSVFGSIASIVAFAVSLVVLRLSAPWALLIGEATEVIYLFVASATEETKTFDVGIVVFFFAGQVALLAGAIAGFMNYTAAWLFAACAAVAIIPQTFGGEPFTGYWMRRAYPLWLQRGAGFARISGRIAIFWAAVFVALTAVSIRWPDAAFARWPVYVAIIGLMVGPLSSAYPTAWIHRAGLKTASAEIFILGLPLMFKQSVDPDTNLSVQFVVSGAEPGSYYVEISEGRCTSGQGDLKEPSLTIYCSTDSWTLVGRGELSPQRAIDAGLLRITGSGEDFSRFFRCFHLVARHDAALAENRRSGARSGIVNSRLRTSADGGQNKA
jgi:two-component sensor histidine kinase